MSFRYDDEDESRPRWVRINPNLRTLFAEGVYLSNPDGYQLINGKVPATLVKRGRNWAVCFLGTTIVLEDRQRLRWGQSKVTTHDADAAIEQELRRRADLAAGRDPLTGWTPAEKRVWERQQEACA